MSPDENDNDQDAARHLAAILRDENAHTIQMQMQIQIQNNYTRIDNKVTKDENHIKYKNRIISLLLLVLKVANWTTAQCIGLRLQCIGLRLNMLDYGSLGYGYAHWTTAQCVSALIENLIKS